MAAEPFALVLHYLRTRVRPINAESATDGQLLARYTHSGEVAAFEALVQRHGPLVWRVCRRVLAHEHDAEDAFQATFLVLVRKASSIRKEASLASWLYGVAHRIAVRARAHAQRWRALELLDPAASVDVPSEASQREVQAIVEEELAQLPERLRAPLLLCCLEGRSRTEAARQLGWREGTVANRLARARQRLCDRLARRGVVLSIGTLAGLLECDAAAVPLRLGAAAVRVAGVYALGETAVASIVSTPATALAKGALQAMFLTKLKFVAALMLVCGIFAGGAGLAVQHILEDQGPEVKGDEPKAVAGSRDVPKPDVPNKARTDYYGDPLPPGAIARMGTVKFRQPSAYVVFSADGKMLITGAADGTVQYWDVAKGKEVEHNRIPLPQTNRAQVILSPDGKVLAAWSGEMVYLYNTATGHELRGVPAGHPYRQRLAFSPDGQVLATMSGLGGIFTIRLWDVATGKERVVLNTDYFLEDLSFSPNGKLLATSGPLVGKEAIRLWDALTGQELRHARTDGEWVAFSPDGKSVASVNRYGTVTLWEVGTLKEQATLRPAVASWTCDCLAFSPDGTLLAVGGDKDLVLWDIAAQKERYRLPERKARRLAFTSDGKILASAGAFEIHLWDVTTGTELHPRPGHDSFVSSVAVSPDGKILATASGDNPMVRLWDAATGKPLSPVLRHNDFIRSCDFSSDGKLVVTSSGSSDGTVRLWETATGNEMRRFVMEDLNGGLRRHEALVCHLSPDGKRLAAVSWTWDKAQREFRQLTVWDAQTGKLLARRPFGGSLSSQFTPDGDGVTVNSKERLTIEDTITGRERITISGDMGHPVAFSPDGRLLAVGIHRTHDALPGGLDGGWQTLGVRVVELATRKEIFHLEGGIDFITFSPDGLVLATADPEGLHLWDAFTGVRLFRRPWPQDLAPGPLRTPIGYLAVLPGGRAAATGMTDGTALVWGLARETWPATEVAKNLHAKDLERLWGDLAAEDVPEAYRAIRALVIAPAQVVPFLAAHLHPAADVDPAEFQEKQIRQLIADLDSNRFALRVAAAKELAKLGERTEPALRQALEGKLSVEARNRVEALMAAVQGVPSTRTLRTLRAIQVLERIGTPEAQQLLRKLATGAKDARETRDAKAALERMGLSSSKSSTPAQ